MTAYEKLAQYYDEFNRDVPYDEILNFYKSLFARAGIKPALVLDLGCGTGNMTLKLAEAGYEVIGTDSSVEMLSQAYSKPAPDGAIPPVYLCQPMEELDLYGTVSAALCCLDGIGYVTEPETLREVFRRVRLFMDPGGVFIFDINSAYRLKNLDGKAYTRENDRAFCVYQADYESDTRVMTYTLDLFERSGRAWQRYTEYHSERAYELDELAEMLKNAGFTRTEFFGDCRLEAPKDDEGRIFVIAYTD